MGRWASVVLGIAVLPGCVTEALWGWDDEDRKPRSHTELVGETREQSEGELELVGDHLRWHSPDGGEIWARPVGDAREAVLAVLSDPEFCEVLDARIEWRRVVHDLAELESSCALELTLGLRREAVVEVVSEAELAPTTVRHLDDATDAGGQSPGVCWHSAFDRPFADLEWLSGEHGPWRVESQAFLGSDGGLAFAGSAGARRPAQSLQERLQALSQVRLFVRMRSTGERMTVKVRPDRLWLATRLRSVRSGAGLVSSLELMPLGHRARSAPAAKVPASYLRCVTQYATVIEQPESDGFGDIALKVMLTPLTLAFDLAVGVVLSKVFGWGDDDDDDGHDSGRLYESHPRRPGESEAQWRARERMGRAGR